MAHEDLGSLGTAEAMGADEREPADLGYKQELARGWNSFTNFPVRTIDEANFEVPDSPSAASPPGAIAGGSE